MRSVEGDDARISISVSTDGTHDVTAAVAKLNPILQDIVRAREAAPRSEALAAMSPIGFGRVHFSRSWSN